MLTVDINAGISPDGAAGEPQPTTDHCCQTMAEQVNWSCDQHPDPFDCPDAVVAFDAKFQEYGLIVHDGGSSVYWIAFCPWCGRPLPESQRDRWFDELEARDIDPWGDDIPTEFQDSRWLNSAQDTH